MSTNPNFLIEYFVDITYKMIWKKDATSSKLSATALVPCIAVPIGYL